MTGVSSMPSGLRTLPSLRLHGGPKQATKNFEFCSFLLSGSLSGMMKSTSRLGHTLETWPVLSSTARKRSTLSLGALACAVPLAVNQSSQRTRLSPVSEILASSWRKTVHEVKYMTRTTRKKRLTALRPTSALHGRDDPLPGTNQAGAADST